VTVHTIEEGAAFFTGLAITTHEREKKALKRVGQFCKAEAKRVLGTYEYGWPSLAQSTIARKAQGDAPGLETGAMRDSIFYRIEGDNSVVIGSDLPRAQFFELGTSRQPPRSFLVATAMMNEKTIAKILSHEMFGWVGVSSTPSFEHEWSYDGED
jgi:HK97 gp10 family phage protein